MALAFTLGYGASFWAMVQTSALNGFRRTIPLIMGIIASDIVITSITVSLFANVLGIEAVTDVIKKPVVLTLGSLAITAIGVFTMTRRAKPNEQGESRGKFVSNDTSRGGQMFVRGFALDILNPMTWVFWLSIVVIVTPMFDGKPKMSIYVFFASVISAQLVCDILKCWLSGQMTRLFSARVMNGINRAVGLLLVGIAVYVFYGFVIKHESAPNDGIQARTVIESVMPQQMLSGNKTGKFDDGAIRR